MDILAQVNSVPDAGVTVSVGVVGAVLGFVSNYMLFSSKKNGEKTKYVLPDLCQERHRRIDETLARIETKLDDVLKD